jgi:hypothetical protein
VRKGSQARGLSADPLRRAVGRDKLGVFGFELLEFFEKLVKLVVRYLGLSLLVVKLVVPLDLGP